MLIFQVKNPNKREDPYQSNRELARRMPQDVVNQRIDWFVYKIDPIKLKRELTPVATTTSRHFEYTFTEIGDYEIEQGSIEDEKVYESLCAYDPIGRLWADTVHYTAIADTLFQLVATDLTPSLANLAPEGTFIQDLEINLSHNEMILKRLE